MTTRRPSYGPSSLISLRARAIISQDTAAAEALNLWKPTAVQNTRGDTQPFPFEAFPRGVIGTIKTSASQINAIFDDADDADDMSDWDTPADNSAWGAANEQPIIHVTSDAVDSDAVTIVDAAPATMHVTTDGHGDMTSPADADLHPPVKADLTPPAAVQVRKSSLADLTNGDRDAISAHLARGLGPHKLLPRFTRDKSKAHDASIVNGASLTEPDAATSVINNTASSDKSGTQTHVSARKLAPHRKLQALAHNVPLPESPAPVALEPATVDVDDSCSSSIVVVEAPEKHAVNSVEDISASDSGSAIITVEDISASDSDSAIITVEPVCDQKDLDPKADAWVPDVTVEFLPPSCPVSPKQAVVSSSEALALGRCCEVESINESSLPPQSWSVPSAIGAFADGDFFDGLVTGGIHQKLLCHYSQYFVTTSEAGSSDDDPELSQIMNCPSWSVFRRWIYDRKLNMGINLKTLVQLWRFGARIQAPMFCNTVADAMIAMAVTTDDVLEAADEIDALLMMVGSTTPFRLLVSHVIAMNGIQLQYKQYEQWPKSIVFSVACMGSQSYVKGSPCAYHLHSLGHNCMS